MPPKGGNASISDAQASASLDYMLEAVAGQTGQARVAKGRD